MKMRQEVISGSFLLEGLPWILQQLPHSSEGCGQQGLHGGIWSGERQWAHRFPRCRPRGSPGPWLDCLSKCWAERELPGVFMSSWRVWGDGNHRTDRGLFIWWLTCLFLLPLEFVKTPWARAQLTDLIPGWQGWGWGRGWGRVGPGHQRSTQPKQAQGVRVCVFVQCWQWCPGKPCLLTLNSRLVEFLLIPCHEAGTILTTVRGADKTMSEHKSSASFGFLICNLP